MCSNWKNELAESAEMLWGFFYNFRNSAGRGQPLSRAVPLGLAAVGTRGLVHCDRGERVRGSGRRQPGRRHRGAPPDGHQWVPAPWLPPHTSRGGWGAGCGGSGRRFGAPSGPFRCLGSSGVVWRATKIRWNPLERHRSGAGLVTATYRPSVREDIPYPRKRPGSTPNPKSGSEIAIDTRSTRRSDWKVIPRS
jgi:hypothetical protein